MGESVYFVVTREENHQYDQTPWNLLSRRGRILRRILARVWFVLNNARSTGIVLLHFQLCSPVPWAKLVSQVLRACPALVVQPMAKLPQAAQEALVGLTAGRDMQGHQEINLNVSCVLQKLIAAGEGQGTGWLAASVGGFRKLYQDWELFVLGLEAKQRVV